MTQEEVSQEPEFESGDKVRVIDSNHPASRYVMTVAHVDEDTGEVHIYRDLAGGDVKQESYSVRPELLTTNLNEEPVNLSDEEDDSESGIEVEEIEEVPPAEELDEPLSVETGDSGSEESTE